MTGKLPARYQIQRQYNEEWITVRNYVRLDAAFVELRRLRTFKNAIVRLWDIRKHREVKS